MKKNKILVSGLVNFETYVKVKEFPIEYAAVLYNFYGIETDVSGVGFNIAKALKTLGAEVDFLSLISKNEDGNVIVNKLHNAGMDNSFLHRNLETTPQSVILYDETGKRLVNLDLKDIQEKSYPEDEFIKRLEDKSIAVMCNINYNRPFLKYAKEHDLIIATDVHTISDVDDNYNRDFMKYADILFLSDEELTVPVDDFIYDLAKEYDNEVIVCGLGENGAAIYVKSDGFVKKFPIIKTRSVVNTIGAGNALFSAFIHFYNIYREPYLSLKKAMLFASYKIGEINASKGFLTQQSFTELYQEVYGL